MPFIPLPFVVAVLLALLLVHLLRARGEAPPNPPFLILIAGCAVQSTLAGLRWGYGIEIVRIAQPIVAAALPALLAASFGGLAWSAGGWRGTGIHAVPPALVAALMAIRPAAVDGAVIAIYLGYAGLLLWMARSGPDGLRRVPLADARSTWRALLAAAGVLVASAAVDALVLVDLAGGDDRRAATLIGIANLGGLFVLGLAASVAGRVRPPAEPEERPTRPPVDVDQEDLKAVVAIVDRLIGNEELFRDSGLNLSRLARRAGLPSRRVSMAVNRVRGKNVSQYINGHRIGEACRLLRETDGPVTRIMFDVGFETKSNFNREFRRVTAMSPAEWRQRARESPGD